MIIQIVSLYHSLSETDLFLKMNYSKSLYSLSSRHKRLSLILFYLKHLGERIQIVNNLINIPAGLRIFIQHPFQQMNYYVARLRTQYLKKRILRANGGRQLLLILPPEREKSGQQIEKYHSARPDIRRPADVRVSPVQLWGHIIRSAANVRADGLTQVLPSETEIHQLDVEFSMVVKYDIFQFEVSVHDFQIMQVTDGLHYLLV